MDVIRMGTDASTNGTPYFEVLNGSTWQRFHVDYTIGSKWQRGYVTQRYRRGTAHCATCHSPHVINFETNLTSLKYQQNPNEMCLPCHLQYRNRVAEHTHHHEDSEASQWVSCHVPRIVDALLFKARSQQIEIPAADLTERFGQQDSPNVCLQSHANKDATWARERLASWRQ